MPIQINLAFIKVNCRVFTMSLNEGLGLKLSFQNNLLFLNLLLLLLSRFSCVRLCATPEKAAHQASPSLGFSRQKHWGGLPFPSPMYESEVTQSCPTLCHPMDCSPSDSSIHGIFQAGVLEWCAIAF